MDYGAHTPFVFAAYAASIIAIAALIFWRLKDFQNARRREREETKLSR
ncbi:MAG: heme exporter protein CcmD [Pseudomonadota bacterium]